jgi:enoyl-CoA hydratase
VTEYAAFTALRIERPEEAILRIVLDGPNINAVGADAHRQLADIWPVIDRDDSVRAVVIQGEGRGFSTGGSFDLIESMVADPGTRTRVMREARDLVYNVINCSKPVVSAIHGPCGRRARRGDARGHLGGRAHREDRRRAHAARCRGR